MAVSIDVAGTYKTTRVDSADTATGWSAVKLEGAGGSPSLLASVGTIDLVAEGTDARAARTTKQRVQIKFTNASGYDFTTGSSGTGASAVPDGNVYIWAAFLAAGSAFTKATGGLQISLGDGTNNSYWNVAGSDTYSGGFKKWAINTSIAADEQSTASGGASTTDAVLGDITEIGFVTDVGGTTTRFDNFVVDASEVGDGLTIQGTTVSDALFAESVTQDETTAIGVISIVEGIIFSQGSLEFSGTSQTSKGETLVFTDTLGGAYTYNLDVTGTVVFTNSSVSSAGVVDYNFDSSGATAFTMNGGGLRNFLTFVTGSGQTISGSVFSDGGTSSIANTLANDTFNQCSTVTVTGAVNSCTFNEATAGAVSTDDTSKVSSCSFTKGSGVFNAVILTGAANTYSWTSTLSGYTVGTASGEGVNVAITGGSITGNEAIHITASTGIFRISVTVGHTPSVSSAGATVYVIAGEKTFTQTISPIPTPDYEYRLYTVTAEGSLDGAVEITAEGEENATSGSHTYTHTETNQPIAVQIISNDYIEKINYYTLTASDLAVTINLDIDNND